MEVPTGTVLNKNIRLLDGYRNNYNLKFVHFCTLGLYICKFRTYYRYITETKVQVRNRNILPMVRGAQQDVILSTDPGQLIAINILYLASIGMVSSKLTLTAEQAGFSSSSFEEHHKMIKIKYLQKVPIKSQLEVAPVSRIPDLGSRIQKQHQKKLRGKFLSYNFL
jgi:hypothetical protein